ncbi:MAG TPA: PKD domain-containing protein [Chloroflexota bacterium]|nr:PKD domain-containing protein [Chloroflexota bacterium]
MNQNNKWQQMISLVISLSLLMQLAGPLAWLHPATALAETAVTPSSPHHPITQSPPHVIALARAQSSYASGQNLTVTYTVHNSLPPTQAPDVIPGQPITDTLAALENFDTLADPNSLRQVILTYEPTDASVSHTSLPAALDDGVYTFHLPDIPPLGSASVTIELDGPATVPDPTALDNGATAWGMVNGRAHTTTTPPTTLWPTNMGNWLACTLDANCADPTIIEQAAQLSQDPTALFTFVRGLGFESYSGSLRGARGTLWSAAGNSTDQASLLIALLRASGIPARYRSGQLADPHIESLLLSMFPQPLGVIGHLPANSPLPQSDPLQNDQLWQETRSHWWVEAYLPDQGWLDMDPSFAQAEIGDRFVDTPDPTPLAELPASLRHTVQVRIKAEMYHPLSGLTTSYPLDYSFSAVELVGEPVALGHIVNSQNQGGMIFANVFHTYTPYLMLAGQELLQGEPFQELMTNFPLATTIVTGEWLLIDLHYPDGTVESHERALYDAIGYDARLNGGNIQVGGNGRTTQPFISDLTLITGLFAPSFVPVAAVDGEYAVAATAVTEGQAAYTLVNDIMADGEVSGDESDDLIAAAQAISRLTRASQRALLMQYAAAADFGTQRLGDSFLVRPYYDAPRLHLMAWETDTVTGQQRVTLDLRRNQIRALAYPTQSVRGWQAFNTAYGLAAMTLESNLLQRLSPDEAVHSVANILSAAQAQGIPLALISPANLADLTDLTISAEAKARITADLLHNPRHFVIVPRAPVLLGDAETVGWLRSDIVSGEIIDISEDGLHMVAVEYSILINGSIQEIGFAIAGFGQGFAGFTLYFLGDLLGNIPGDLKSAWGSALAAAEQWASAVAEEIAARSDHEWVDAFLNGAGVQGGGTASTPVGEVNFGEFDLRQGGFTQGTELAASVIGSADPPLPSALAARLPAHDFFRPAVGVVAATASSSGTAVSANLLLESFTAQGTLSANWQYSAQSGLLFQQLSGQGQLFVDGALVDNGVVTAVADVGHLETSGALSYQQSGPGGMGFYAAAVSGLGSGAYGEATAVTLTPATTAELHLRGASATLNGQVYSGDLTLVTTMPVAVQNKGVTAAPHFAPSASLAANNASLGLPPTSGTLTIGGTAVSLQDGLLLPNFNGTIAVSEATAATDQVSLAGDAHYVRLATSPANSTTTPGSPATFQAAISANFSDSYTVTLSAPGWDTAVAADGSLTVTPTLTTPPGDYTLLLTAQSGLYPTAVAAAEHTVTVNPMQGVDVSIQPDPIYTIPFGTPTDPANPTTNNGQAQIPGAAYTVQIVNRSSQPHTFDVSVTGMAPDWLIFAGEEGQTAVQITLPAGGSTWMGLYVQPATPTLPAPGSSYPFAVTAVASTNPTITDSDNTSFVMPAIPFQHLWLEPTSLFALSDAEAEFTVYLRNVGNAPGSFDLAARLPAGWQLTGLQSPVLVNPGQTSSQVVTLDVPAAPLGSAHQVTLSSPVPNQAYTQWATLNTRLVSANTAPIFAAAAGCLADETALAAALQSLALAVSALEASCDGGNCALALRNQAVAAANSAANYGRLTSPLGQTYTALETAAATLSAAANDAAILAALPGISTAVTDLETELCAIKAHRPTVRLTPWMNAALPNQPVEFDLHITNRGTVTTTYAVTVTLPDETLTFPQTIAPGATAQTAVPAVASDLALYLIDAEVTAVNTPLDYITAQAQARLNVVDRFIQVTAVAADPPFVETGISSTTLQVEIANIAGIGQSGVVDTAVYAANGTLQWSDSLPLNILGGAPRTYDLTTLDTSGWAAGVYTITANVLLHGAPTTGGDGYGHLSVGQAVIPSHAVAPDMVAPGTVTVTTSITMEINSQASMSMRRVTTTIYDGPLTAADLAYLNRTSGEEPSDVGAGLVPAPVLGQPQGLPVQQEVEERPLTDDNSLPLTPFYSEEPDNNDLFIIPNSQFLIPFSPAFTPAFTRTEQNDPAWSYTGTWTNVNLQQVSGGSYWRNATAGSTAQLTFDGTWISLGFLADRFSGYATVTIDGDSYGTLDLYRNEATPISFLFADLPGGSHTLTLTVLGAANPFASNTRVQLDSADFGDGSALPGGDFEQDDARLLKSNGWSTTNYAGASGGSYISSSNATAWFPFTGESFRLHTLAYSSADKAQLWVDGVYLDTIDLFAPVFASAALTRTFAYTGFTPGPHVLQVMTYQGLTAIDKLTTPAAGPFIDPNPPVSGVTRYEADYPAILYNGVPFTQTAQSWNRIASIVSNRASDGEYIYSAAANDTISFSFEGDWLGIGFTTDRFGGQADIAIDGQPVQTVDLYSREDDTASVYFNGLGAGPHTVTITVLGASHPNATGTRVHLDFIEVWDGQPLAEGTFEENNGRLFTSNGWGRTLESNASGGAYASNGNPSGTIWFPFTGDSVTFQAWAQLSHKQFEIRIDGMSQGLFDLYAYANSTRTFSFDGLGSGPHVLEVRQYRETVTVDAFHTPAIEPATEPPPATPITRYEENHPAMRYNGHPHRTMGQSWLNQSNWQTSGSYNVSSSTVGNSWRLEFEGVWVNLGFHSVTGAAEIFIDGVSQGIVQTADGTNQVINFPFGDLTPGPHTVEAVVVSGTVRPDYIDVWHGQPLADGWYDAQLEGENGRFHFSNKTWWRWAANQYAWEGDYLTNFASSQNNIWFTFTGTDLTVLGYQRANTSLHVVIDGVYQGVYDMTPEFSEQPFALHFPDLGEGAHVAQVFSPSSGGTVARVDAFHVNPPDFYSHTPVVEWVDFTAQESLPGTINTGFATTIAIGDLNGDGVVELVAPGLNGRLYVYRGDEQDAGNGSPILWTSDLVGPAAEPALADITGDGNAEIILSGREGTFAFTHDGNLLWHNPDVVSFYTVEELGWGGPSVGNLDLDPEPEIVIAASQDGLYVLDHLGVVQWSTPIADRFPPPPVLADITGDGILDIVMADQWEMRVYDYFNGGQLVWSRLLPDPIVILGGGGAFGAPAVADLTGDGQPEIIINWGHVVEALHSDGSVLWRYLTNNNNLYRPSPITVADVTGDGQMNVVTASAMRSGFNIFNHLLMVLDANGNLVWEQLVADNTASASGVAVQDLTGNGAWEILWNGATDGFLILRGADGKRLFNEPVTASGTVLDYPTLGDVDGDGLAEVVVSGSDGIFIIGHDGRWADSRPIWNQHNYHVTNINDDWSVPISEQNSWELHNTYRTQTPERSPAPSYRVELTHTVGVSGVAVLSDTFSTPPGGTPPAYHWQYQLEWYAPVNTITFASELADMQPGETRQINQGTEVAYRLPSGWNTLTLPPLFVTAVRILDIAPVSQTAGVGSTAVYTLTLLNPGLAADVYDLEVMGLPADWLDYPAQVNVPAQSSIEVLLEVTIPLNAELTERPFAVIATTGSGGQDMTLATLTPVNGLSIAIKPPLQSAPTGTAVTYTLTLTNGQLAMVNYQLAARGLADVTLPDAVEVGAGATVSFPITVSSAAPGPQPFTVTAVGAGGHDTADAILEATGNYAVGLALAPIANVGGPGTPATFDLTVTNLGDVADGYDLALALPSGWSGQLEANGAPVDEIALPAHLFNSADLRLRITPPVTAVAGDYEFSVTAVSQSGPGVQSTITGTVELLPLGVVLTINPAHTSLSPLDSGVWQVTITNTGEVADSYDLLAAGIISLTAELSSSTVTLAPGQSQTVQLTAGPLPLVLPQTVPFWVTAVSQTDTRIANEAAATITFTGYEGVAVAWLPASQTVTNTLAAAFMLVISNTGNVPTTYQLGLDMPGLSGQLPAEVTIPARATAVLPLSVQAGTPGMYTLTATAASATATNEATATLTIVQTAEVLAVNAGPDQEGYEGSPVAFNGEVSGGSEPYTVAWDFGDGHTATGSLAPVHTYADNGSYTVTLLVTDGENQVVSDSLVVAVNNVPPLVTAVADQTIPEQETISGVLATFSDAGVLDGHTAIVDWGDGAVTNGVVNQAAGTVSGSHSYAAPGVYTVTITVTDNDGGAGSDTLLVMVTPDGYQIYLPVIVR